jgi:DNA-binding NtrC family response regulator
MTHLRNQIHRVAPYFRTALLLGERNCGEEAAAHILHQLSPLSHRPFQVLTPAESELLFSAESSPDTIAAVGMLYLPRPEHLSPTAQTALLRLVRKHGSQAPRIVVFAESGLRPLVSAGGFSAELAESLGALRIALPPLRERAEDLPALLTHLLQEIAAQSNATPPQLAPDLLDAVMQLPWPGNLTQLRGAAVGLMKHAAKIVLHASDLENVLSAIAQPVLHDRRKVRMIRLDDVIQEHIRAVLFACNGNKLRTAEVLGISRSTLYRMLDAQVRTAAEPVSSTNLRRAG